MTVTATRAVGDEPRLSSAALRLTDTDGDGKASAAELRAALGRGSIRLSRDRYVQAADPLEALFPEGVGLRGFDWKQGGTIAGDGPIKSPLSLHVVPAGEAP